MSFKNCEEVDLNSVFDGVGVDKQSETIRLNSFEEGKKAGNSSGYEKGFEFGLMMATAYGSELGYCSFLAKHWKNKLQNQQKQQKKLSFYPNDVNNERKLQILNQLIEICDNAPKENDPNVEFSKLIHKLQIKFKQVNSLFGDKKQFNGPNFLSLADKNSDASTHSTCSSKSALNIDF